MIIDAEHYLLKLEKLNTLTARCTTKCSECPLGIYEGGVSGLTSLDENYKCLELEISYLIYKCNKVECVWVTGT